MKQYTKSEAIRIAEQCETKEDLEKHDMHLTLNDLFIERTGMPYYSITYYNKDNKIVLLAQFWEKEQITKDYFKWLEQAPIIPFEQDALDLIKQIL